MQTNLRPLSFGEILDGAFTLYRRNFVSFAATALVSLAALLVLAAVLGFSAFVLAPYLGDGPVLLLVALLVFTAIASMGMLMWGALAWRAAHAYTGRSTTLGESLEAGGRSAMTLVGVGVAAALLSGAASWALGSAARGAAFVLGGSASPVPQVLLALVSVAGMLGVLVLLGASFFATLPAVVLEERGPIQAISRSFSLVKGARGRVAGVLLVALVITTLPGVAVMAATVGVEVLYAPASIASSTAELALRLVMEQLLTWIVNVLTAPFLASVVVLLYYDRRVRSEALDVRMAADRLAIAGD